MLAVEEALQLVEEKVSPLAPRRVQLGNAAGLVLAERVVSEVNSPPYDKTLMDGYAVVSSDRSQERKVIEEIGAGSVPRHAVIPGTATRLMTGAPIPEGADAIVPIERTEMVDDRTVRLVDEAVKPGQHLLRMGASLRAGDTVLEQGGTLRPIEIGILAEVGHGIPLVHPRPRLAVLPTGDELVSVGEHPGPGQIRNSNGPMIVASAARDGAAAEELPIADDDPSMLRELISRGLEADVLVLSGGVSAGKFDLVPQVLGALDVRLVFHKIALRPGKPLWFGVKESGDRRAYVFSLPGNPVSSLVCYELFVRPTISALGGRGFVGMTSAQARLAHDFHYKGGRASCLPARLLPSPPNASAGGEAPPAIEILPWHGSADLATLGRADALVRLGTQPIHLPAGSLVDLLRL